MYGRKGDQGEEKEIPCFRGLTPGTVLLTVLGGFYLSIKTAATIPEGLIALGSTAVGALAGLLAPSPMK